jgi:putative ABC transport system permease protein
VTLLGLVFAVGLIFTQMAIYLGLMENASIVIDHTPGDIWITSKNCRNFEFSQPFPEFIHNHVCATEGIESAEKLIIAWGIIKNKDGGSEQVEIIGYNPDTGVGGPWKMKAGDPRAVKNGDFIVVDESAKRLGNFAVGDYRGISAGLGYLVSLSLTLLSVKFYEVMEIPMVMRGWVNIAVLGLTVAMCFSASSFSMRKVRKIDPAVLFRG